MYVMTAHVAPTTAEAARISANHTSMRSHSVMAVTSACVLELAQFSAHVLR